MLRLQIEWKTAAITSRHLEGLEGLKGHESSQLLKPGHCIKRDPVYLKYLCAKLTKQKDEMKNGEFRKTQLFSMGKRWQATKCWFSSAVSISDKINQSSFYEIIISYQVK